ncbi:amidohydrolase [Ilyomonas limi]|uniref:Amidohydrolase n=2 Tax=Ilyomonas limi TaxID=2575867 RepID=A0A4U3KXC6_9BACT|nr:amidohydrolase [Ilyomonas limi]
MFMTDTHVHIWNFERAYYEWLDNNTTILNRNYFIEELESERKKAGITKGVLVQAANTLKETAYMLDVAHQTAWIKGVVGWLPLMDTKATEKILSQQYIHEPYIKGIRHLIHDEPDSKWLLQKEVMESLQLVADCQLAYDVVGILDEHLRCAIAVAEKIPSLKLVLDHMNHPMINRLLISTNWYALMKEAAKYPNIYVKISGLGTCLENASLSVENAMPYIAFVLETFSTDRCFCGGDWPVSLLANSYKKTWEIYTSVLAALLDSEALKKVYDDNAANFYKLDL